MAWVVPALIGAGIAAGAAGLAHDITGFISGKTPWDNPGEWVTGALKAGAIGFGTGFLGGAAGAALGPAMGSTAGSATGGSEGAVAGGATGSTAGTTTGSTMSDVVGMIGENTGTVAAESGAPTPASIAGIIPKDASAILSQGTQGPMSLMREAVGKIAMNAGMGALQDRGNPIRGALVGAAGAAANSGLNFVGQATGILPSAQAPNFQPGGDMGYSADSASVMPPTPGYTSSGFGPSLGTRAMGAAGQLGVRAGTMGAKQFVGNLLTPQPQPPPMGTYQSFGIKPYWEQGPFA